MQIRQCLIFIIVMCAVIMLGHAPGQDRAVVPQNSREKEHRNPWREPREEPPARSHPEVSGNHRALQVVRLLNNNQRPEDPSIGSNMGEGKYSSSELERHGVFQTELEEPTLNRYISFFD